jgi:hypothetical protein
MHGAQPSSGQPAVDHPAPQASLQELPTGHQAVLTIGQRTDHPIGRLTIGRGTDHPIGRLAPTFATDIGAYVGRSAHPAIVRPRVTRVAHAE